MKLQIKLISSKPEHAELFFRWRNETAAKLYNPLAPLDLEGCRLRLSKEGHDLRELRDRESFRWFVEQDGDIVGNVSLNSINKSMLTAEVGYGIGEEFQSRGLGTQAVSLLVDKVFTETPLRKLVAFVHERNIPSRRILKNLGFHEEGLLREHYIINGVPDNEIIFGLLKREWDKTRNQNGAKKEKYSFLSVKKLEGKQITLTPIQEAELELAASALISPSTWFSKTRRLNSVEAFRDYFIPLLERQMSGACLSLLARLKATGEIVGMSTYQYPAPNFRKVEIGFTWIADKWQRTFVNTEMKYLMLSHAFEKMNASRVEFSVHPENERSNAAVRRIGASFEGTLRKWRFLPGTDDGNRSIYSIIDDEWPRIRKRLEKLME